MKKIILPIFAIIVSAISYGQSEYHKLPSFGIHFFVNDFATAAEIRSTNLTEVIKNKQYYASERMNPGLAISLMKGIHEYIDLNASLAGSFVDYDVPDAGRAGGTKFFLEAAFTGNLKVLSDRYIVNPFLTAGIGGYSYRSTFGAFIPLGAGIQVKLAKDIFALANAQYRIPVTEKAVYHFYYSLGVAAPLVSRKETVVIPPPPPPPVVLDRDNDGVLDADDKCPDVPGLAALQGCPDRDGDGIADADDKCPDVAGLGKYNGCPIPDTDGDGINDEQDKCPNEKGFARYNGCPIPDSDADGVNDEEDKCPTRPGPASNQGCPEIAKEVIEKINFAAKNIFFATGSSKLLPKSFKSLDEVAKLLASDQTLLINIDGYTDNTGKAEKNQILSEARAASVKAYLVKKGLAETRAGSAGHGDANPIADNKTAAGRAKNRRTEMTVRNY
jgi:outer membrane protein OmpA-like peptidoglycan-associated protein